MMRYVKSLITLLCVSCLCVLLVACGKSDGIVGNKYKAIYKNKVEAIVEFKDNGDLVYTVAEGAFDAGREEHGKYEVIEENGKKLLLTTGIYDSKFFSIEDRDTHLTGTNIEENKGGKEITWEIFNLKLENTKVNLKQVEFKKNPDKVNINRDEIKDLEVIESQNDNRILEKTN